MIYKNIEYSVEIPINEYWTNNVEAKFVISFHNSMDKQVFLKKYRNRGNFRIDFYVYSKCRVWNIKHTNMIGCHAIRHYDDSHILQEIFNGEIPF